MSGFHLNSRRAGICQGTRGRLDCFDPGCFTSVMITFGWFLGITCILIEPWVSLVMEVIICKDFLEEATHGRISTTITSIRKRRELRTQKDYWSVTVMWTTDDCWGPLSVLVKRKVLGYILIILFRFAIWRYSLCCFMWPLSHFKLLPKLFLSTSLWENILIASCVNFVSCLLLMRIWKKI